MKWFIRITIPLLVMGGCVFGDIQLAKWLFAHLPDISWIFWAKLGVSFVIFWLTFGLIVIATVLSGAIAVALTE